MARRSGGAVARHHSSDGRLPDIPSPPGAGCGRVATVPGPVPFAVAPEMGLPLIAARVGGDVARFVAGEPLVGLVDLAAGY
jgi:hypothetical protein